MLIKVNDNPESLLIHLFILFIKWVILFMYTFHNFNFSFIFYNIVN